MKYEINSYEIPNFAIAAAVQVVFLGKGVPKICIKFTGEHPCRSVNSIKLLCNFIAIALQHGCSPVNLLHFFRIPFPKNTSERVPFVVTRQVV